MSNDSNVFPKIVGQADFITVDFLSNLDRVANDQVVVSATWVVEDGAIAALVASSEAVDATGRYASAKFSALAEGMTRILVTATTADPVATIPVYVVLWAYVPPSGV